MHARSPAPPAERPGQPVASLVRERGEGSHVPEDGAPPRRGRRRRLLLDEPAAAVLLLALAAAAAPAAPAPTAVRLDEAIERDSGWILTPGRVEPAVVASPTRGTPRALALRWRRDLGELKGDGSFGAPQVPGAWIPLPPGVDLSRFTRLSLHVRLDGARHGFLHVVVSERAGEGPGVMVHRTNVPLDEGGWRAAEVALDLASPEVLRAARFLGFFTVNLGRPPGEPAVATTFVDDVVLTAGPPPLRTGWTADPSVIALPLTGWGARQEKLAVVHPARIGEAFTVTPAGSDEVALSGRVLEVASATGRHGVLDLTLLVEPGTWVVRLGPLVSQPFRVGEDAARQALDLVASWVLDMRCGVATGLHDACHLDDAVHVRGPLRRSLPVSGGWHDAGDVRTYYEHTAAVPALLLAARATGFALDRDGDGRDDLEEGAALGLAHLARIVDPDTGELLWKVDDRDDNRRGNYWTDNVRGNADDRHVIVRPELVTQVADACASAGLAARLLGASPFRDAVPPALATASARWQARLAGGLGRPAREAPVDGDPGHGYVAARVGQGSLELARATGAAAPLELARSCASWIMSRQPAIFPPGAVEPMTGDLFRWHRTHPFRDAPEALLAALVQALPGDKDRLRWRAALRRVADWWMKPARAHWRPYSVPDLLVSQADLPAGALAVPLAVPSSAAGGREPALFVVPTAGTDQLGDTALALHAVAAALGDAELERLARRQVEWAFGLNPFAASWVSGLGDRAMDQMYSFAQGAMPGAVAGFGIGDDGVPRCYRPHGAEPRVLLGAQLLAAAAAVTRPARFELLVWEDARPWSGVAEVRWARTGEVVHLVAADAAGRVAFALDGGEEHDLRLGGAVLPLVAVGGTTTRREVDLASLVVARLAGPREAVARQPFALTVELESFGARSVDVPLALHVEGAQLEESARTVALGAGLRRTLEWPLRAGGPNRPWVAVLEARTTWSEVVDATGRVVPPPVAGRPQGGD